jgi:LuxR family transcriptional regulator, maltose regulon positive regulatory protein
MLMAPLGGLDSARRAQLTAFGVIAGKLAPARLPQGWVARPALIECLRAGRGRALTLVSAPAGFGKTTLLTAWANQLGPRVAWVSLDRGDADPARLWAHVIAALAAHEPLAGTTSLPALRARPAEIEQFMLPRLLEEIPREGPELTLILDDFHLAESAGVDTGIKSFMDYRPDRVQVVVSTRSDPALGVARLRASGDLAEVRARDLRFDVDDFAAFLDGMGLPGLTPADQHRLVERTGGWPAPLRLLALLLPEADHEELLESLTRGNRPLVDYLNSDVVDLLTPEVHDFVLRASILGRMNASLCDAVVGTRGSGEILANLERSNLFTSADSTGEWYQLHHLFAEALRLELARTRPELVRQLHLRAAQWFEDNGDLETATTHAIASHDLALATRLVTVQAQSLDMNGRWVTVRNWLSELSWPEAQADPELAFARAVEATYDSDLDLAERWLDVASAGPSDLMGSMSLPLGFRRDFLRAIVGVNDVARAQAAALRAIDSAPAPGWRGVALAGLGQAQYLRGRLVEAQHTLLGAVGLIPDANPSALTLAIGNLALAEYAEGSGRHAAPLLDPALEMLQTIGLQASPSSAILHMACGERARTNGDPRGATRWFDAALDILGPNTRSAWRANAHLLHACASHALGDAAAETSSLEMADAILDRLPDPGDLRARSRQLRQGLPITRHVAEFGEQLSSREVAVLQLAADGLTQREVADQLFISYNTVKSHLKATYRKLGATSRDDALARWAALNMVVPEPPSGTEPTP